MAPTIMISLLQILWYKEDILPAGRQDRDKKVTNTLGFTCTGVIYIWQIYKSFSTKPLFVMRSEGSLHLAAQLIAVQFPLNNT